MRSPKVQRGRQGSALIYTVVMIVVLMGVISLSVDFGRVTLAKSQLQLAADTAARAARMNLSSGVTTARSSAISIAARNTADGTAIALINSDIEFGTWSDANQTFTLLSGAAESTANAVRVTARRTTARGNPIALSFAGMIGLSTLNLTATATARCVDAPVPGFVGINSVTYTGSGMLDSYDSASGVYTAGTSTHAADIYSNGNISLTGSGTIYGDAQPGVGGSVTGSSTVTGSTTALTTALTYPAASAGSYATTNDNSLIAAYMTGSDFEIAGGTVHLSAGTYYVHDMTLRQATNLYLDGPVTFYVTGTFLLQDSAQTKGNRPQDFKINVISSNAVTIKGSNTFEAQIYAPLSDVTLAQSRKMCGSVIGKTLTITNSAQGHFDTSLLTTSLPTDLQLVR